MPYLEGSTGIQKLIIMLFVATIALSCVSLIWMIIEKPDKVTTQCEHTGGLRSMKAVAVNFSDLNNDNIAFVPNCTTTVNPPMSSGLSLIINLSIVCAGFFLAAAAIAYTTRKKGEPEEEPEEPEVQTPDQ